MEGGEQLIDVGKPNQLGKKRLSWISAANAATYVTMNVASCVSTSPFPVFLLKKDPTWARLE